MARIRSVHPGMFTDEAFVELSHSARVFYIGLLTECDDAGVFEWKPKTLNMRLFPADQVDVTPLLVELLTQKMVIRFDFEDKIYGAVRNFQKWQRPKKPTYRYPLPHEYRTFVGAAGDGSETRPPDVGGLLKEVIAGGNSKNHIDKPVVVVVPPEPEKPAGTTTTTKVENDLVLQVEAAAKLVSPLEATARSAMGTALPEDWIPDESCMKLAFDSGMNGAEVESEVIRFHALNAQRGTFSQNWNKTWTLWCSEFKRRKDKEAAKAPPRVEVSKADPNYVPTERDWDSAAKIYAQIGRWNVSFGPEPTSPACRCPPDILAKYIVNQAAVPVLAARAKVSA